MGVVITVFHRCFTVPHADVHLDVIRLELCIGIYRPDVGIVSVKFNEGVTKCIILRKAPPVRKHRRKNVSKESSR